MNNDIKLSVLKKAIEAELKKAYDENRIFNYKKRKKMYHELYDVFKEYSALTKKDKINMFSEENPNEEALSSLKSSINNKGKSLGITNEELSVFFKADKNLETLIVKMMNKLPIKNVSPQVQMNSFHQRGEDYKELIENFNNSGGRGYYDVVCQYNTDSLMHYRAIKNEIKSLISDGADIIIKHLEGDKDERSISFVTNSGIAAKVNSDLASKINHKRVRKKTLLMIPDLNRMPLKEDIRAAYSNDFDLNNYTPKNNNFLNDYYSVACKQGTIDVIKAFASISTKGSGFELPHRRLKNLSNRFKGTPLLQTLNSDKNEINNKTLSKRIKLN